MTNREKLVEAVARAVWHRNVGYKRVPWDALDVEDQDVFRAYARAALAATEASGWRVVPVEMTPEMDGAALHANMNPPHQADGSVSVRAQNKHIYAALLSAAPKVTP